MGVLLCRLEALDGTLGTTTAIWDPQAFPHAKYVQSAVNCNQVYKSTTKVCAIASDSLQQQEEKRKEERIVFVSVGPEVLHLLIFLSKASLQFISLLLETNRSIKSVEALSSCGIPEECQSQFQT